MGAIRKVRIILYR